MLALLAIAFCWILKVGQHLAEQRPRLVKKCKHGRPRYSITELVLTPSERPSVTTKIETSIKYQSFCHVHSKISSFPLFFYPF